MAKRQDPKKVEGFSGAQGVENLMPKMEATFPKPAVDINTILQPYIDELTRLGPEYGAEMAYLQPYLTGTPTTFQGLQQQSAADQSPTGSKSLQTAEAGVATAMENQPKPGFGNLAQSAKQYEGTIPYSQVLQSVLEAGKNQILGYSTIPNLTNLAAGAAQTWSPQMQAVLPYLEQSIGSTAQGTPNATQLGIASLAQPGGFQGGIKPQTGVSQGTLPSGWSNQNVNPSSG